MPASVASRATSSHTTPPLRFHNHFAMGATEHRTLRGTPASLPSPMMTFAGSAASSASLLAPPAAAHEPRCRQDHGSSRCVRPPAFRVLYVRLLASQIQHARDVFYSLFTLASLSVPPRPPTSACRDLGRRLTLRPPILPSLEKTHARGGGGGDAGAGDADAHRHYRWRAHDEATRARVSRSSVDGSHTVDPGTRLSPPALARDDACARLENTGAATPRAHDDGDTRGAERMPPTLLLPPRATHRDEDTIPSGTSRARGGEAAQGRGWAVRTRSVSPPRVRRSLIARLPQYPPHASDASRKRRGEVSLQAARTPPSTPRLSPAARCSASHPARDDTRDERGVCLWRSSCHPPPARAHSPPDRETAARARFKIQPWRRRTKTRRSGRKHDRGDNARDRRPGTI
ncbi:hypothetical protein FB451DRAFT_1408867 [Mycena latifolia]|nr:hypothetical protein FB451DRAFT_1408867 [Mycena latifolia]